MLRAARMASSPATAVEPGQVVQPGFAAIRLARTAEKEAVVAIPDRPSNARATSKAVVTLWSNANARYEATSGAVARRRRGHAHLSGEVHDSDRGSEVQLGMTATVTLDRSGAWTVSSNFRSAAVVDQGNGPIRLDRQCRWQALPPSRSPLRPTRRRSVLGVRAVSLEGDRVVLIGAQKLDAGVLVRAVDQFSFWRGRRAAMGRFNLSRWAVEHRPLVLFMIIAIALAGALSFQRLGRSEDPNFTIKVAVLTAVWPGATAREMQDQVADLIEKKLQELPHFDKVQTYVKPSFAAHAGHLPRRHATRRSAGAVLPDPQEDGRRPALAAGRRDRSQRQ